ncbi:hypothetical protein ABPG77_010192 [Micractinium sp. CCAP 211/92]
MSAEYSNAILAALDEVEAPGELACGGQSPRGVGPLTLPLSPEAAAALAGVVQPAPYGRGAATLVDPAVRRCVQLEPAQMSLRNEEAWGAELGRVVAAAAEGLGLPPQALQAELYKCLLYGPGDFFSAHKDTEKAAGMVATLAICLPRRCAKGGGRLLVRHGGQQQAFFAGRGVPGAQPQPKPCRCSWAAFFADCEHEVQALTAGHRICLIYNLLHVGEKPSPAAPDMSGLDATLGALRSALAAWQADGKGPQKLCYVLEHQYTEAGIAGGLRALKGPDRAAALALQYLAAEGLLDVHLAILEKHEMGSAEEDDWYRGYSKRRRCCCYDDDYDDEEEEEEEGCGGHTMQEVTDEERSVAHWTTLEGKAMGFGAMHVREKDELLPPGYFDDQEPDEEEYEGYTGNAGATLDRWYCRAALVMWPRSRRFSILAGTNIAGATCQLGASLAAGEPRAECATFASAILDHLQRKAAAPALGYAAPSHASLSTYSDIYPSGVAANSLAQLMGSIAELAALEAAAELLQACFGRPDKRAEAVALLLSLCKHAAKAATALGAAGAAAEQACVAGLCQLVVSKPAAMAQLLEALAALGGGPQLALAQRLLPHAMADVDASTVQALLLPQRRFGWAAVRPAAQRIVSDCQADSGRLPHSMALLRKLAEAAGESSTGGASSRGSANEQQQAMPTAPGPVAAPGKENASTSQQPRHEQAAAVPTNQKQQQQQQQQQSELQAELASLLAAALDVALNEADSPEQGARHAVQPPQYSWQVQQTNQAQQAQRTRSAVFVDDAFRAVCALLPAVGAAPLHKKLGREAAAGCPALLALTRGTAQRLRVMAQPLLAAQKDWRLEGVSLGCPCGDCMTVQRFLMDPTKATMAMPLAEKRGKHVHQALDRRAPGLVTHVTQRTGRPYSLILTKTRAQWEKNKVEGQRLQGRASELEQLLPAAGAGPAAIMAVPAVAAAGAVLVDLT